MPDLDAAIRNVPEALLLDFGGVVFQSATLPDGRGRMTTSIVARLARAEQHLDPAFVRGSLDAALTALTHWKHAASRRREPRELSHHEVVGDFLAADYPAAAREVLVAEAADLLAELTTTLSVHTVRPGVRELLDVADAIGVPVGIVSNAHSGRSHRALVEAHGLGGRFAAQCYSDEVGLRKPNPRIIELAATALGTVPGRCWYVGDTRDRDVVAGRRAGVAAVILTRSHHTDAPPFPVADTPDAVFDTPEGLVEALRGAGPWPEQTRPSITAGTDRRGHGDLGRPVPAAARRHGSPRAALLIDHGGVISRSEPDPEAMAGFAATVARLLSAPGETLGSAEVLALLETARANHKAATAAAGSARDRTGSPLAEVEPLGFWRDRVGATLSPRQRAVLQAEAHELMFRLGMAKSRRTLRSGVRELLTHCRAAGMPVVVVTNTVSGRAVRAVCAEHGIDHLIGAYVCSDEVGVRKPDPRIVHRAIAVADAMPQASWFYGDKPGSDAVGALEGGIGHRVLARGGSTPDAVIDAALASGLATHAVSGADELLALIVAAAATADAPSGPPTLSPTP